MTAYDQIKTTGFAPEDEDAVLALKRDSAELPLAFYEGYALAYATQLLCPCLDSRPWWLAQMKARAALPTLLTIAPVSIRGCELHLERCLRDAWQGIFGSLSMVPERWERFTCISLRPETAAADIASFSAGNIPHDGAEPDFATVVGQKKTSLKELEVPHEGSQPQGAFCIVPQDAGRYMPSMASIASFAENGTAALLGSLSSPEWRIAVCALALVDGGPTVALMPVEFLSSAAGEKDRALLVREGIITQVLELPPQDCPEQEPLALVRLGKQEAYGASHGLSLQDDQVRHLTAKDIRLIDAGMEHLRCGAARAQGESFSSLLQNGAFTRWVDAFDMQALGYSLVPSDYSVRAYAEGTALVRLGNIARFKRGLPNRASAGTASFEAFYRKSPWEGADASEGAAGPIDVIDCKHVSFTTVESGEIIDVARCPENRFPTSRFLSVASPAASKKLAHYLRTGALYRIDEDNSVIAIARSKNSFKAFLIENPFGADPVYVSVSASVLAAALRRNPETGTWDADPHYLLAYLTSTDGQARLKGAVRGSVVEQLAVGALADIEIPLASREAQQAIGSLYAAETGKLVESERETQRAREGVRDICDEIFAGTQFAAAHD